MDTQTDIRGHLATLQNLAPAGFAIACHIRYTTSQYLFQTYAKDWIAHYNQNGLVMKDPIVAWTFANNGVRRWRDLADMDMAGVLQEARKFGMNHGVAIGFEADDSRTVAGFARSDREFDDAEVAQLQEITAALHGLTAEIDTLDSATRAALRKMSIEFTHP
jgi:LuxR family transcriptional regulator